MSLLSFLHLDLLCSHNFCVGDSLHPFDNYHWSAHHRGIQKKEESGAHIVGLEHIHALLHSYPNHKICIQDILGLSFSPVSYYIIVVCIK